MKKYFNISIHFQGLFFILVVVMELCQFYVLLQNFNSDKNIKLFMFRKTASLASVKENVKSLQKLI